MGPLMGGHQGARMRHIECNLPRRPITQDTGGVGTGTHSYQPYKRPSRTDRIVFSPQFFGELVRVPSLALAAVEATARNGRHQRSGALEAGIAGVPTCKALCMTDGE